jgi:hypothetical protein
MLPVQACQMPDRIPTALLSVHHARKRVERVVLACPRGGLKAPGVRPSRGAASSSLGSQQIPFD